MKTNLTIIALMALVLVSCNKDDEEEMPCTPTEENEGSGSGGGGGAGVGTFDVVTSIGSYWVYDWYRVPYDGAESTLSIRDTIYISGDTLINENEYTVFEGTWYTSNPVLRIERDSSGYIVNQYGRIVWSYENFTDTLWVDSFPNPLSWHIYGKMNNTELVNTPAGVFAAIELIQSYYYPSGEVANNCGDLEIPLSNHYADGMGLVKAQFGFSGPLMSCAHYDEARLVEYYIAP